MGRSPQPLLLLPLAAVFVFSYLFFSSSAVPVTRSGGLMHIHGIPGGVLEHANLMKEQKRSSVMNGRVAVEVDDYPGSGANNRHTPRAFSRGCADC